MLQQLEQVLFRPPNVAGWEGGRTWITTNSLLNRYNIAGYLIKGPQSGYQPPPPPQRNPQNSARALNREKRRQHMMERHLGHKGAELCQKIAATAHEADSSAWVDSVMSRFFHQPVPAETRAAYQHFIDEKKGQPLSAEVIGDLLHLMMSTPHYQLC
jgi:hypothetical protein